MLGKAHQITTYRQGKAYPKRMPLTEEVLALASDLLFAFEENRGRTRAELEEELKVLYEQGQPPKVIDGLTKLCLEQSRFEQPSSQDLGELRAEIFDQSAHFWRSQPPDLEPEGYAGAILPALREKTTEQVESWLFGDLSSNQRLLEPPRLDAKGLLERYDLAQAQALLLTSHRLELTLSEREGAAFRQLMKMLKFHGLLFELKREKEGVTLVVEGPQSLLEHGKSYGLELANFFAAVVLLQEPWSLKAFVQRSGVARDFVFETDHKGGYQSYLSLEGVFFEGQIAEICQRYNEKYPGRAEPYHEVIELGRGRFLVSDIFLEHAGERRLLELVRYQSKSSMDRLKAIAKAVPRDYYFLIKAKGAKKKQIQELLGDRAICYATDLTAATLKKALS